MEAIPLAKPHSIEDCILGLKQQTPAEPGPKVLELLRGFEESGFDPLLGTIIQLLRRNTIPHVLSFLRVFNVLDVSDCERISNKCVNQTTEEEIMALVNILNSKGPHAYWYFVHSMQEHQQFFTQMHGKITCCVCKEVESYDLFVQKEIERELSSDEPSLQLSRQREVLNDLFRRVEQLRASYSCLESSFTQLLDRIKPFPDMVENLSQRFRNEIKDVMIQDEPDRQVCGHTTVNTNVIYRLKVKYVQIKRQIENKLHFHPREVLVNTDESKSDRLKEVVCKEPNPYLTYTEGKESLPCRTYEDFWIEFEDKCFERMSQCNPFTAIQRCLGSVLDFGQKHKVEIFCAVGITICFKIVGSYVVDNSGWTQGPRPLFS